MGVDVGAPMQRARDFMLHVFRRCGRYDIDTIDDMTNAFDMFHGVLCDRSFEK